MGTYPHRSYREESRTNWGTSDVAPHVGLTVERIQLGAILRIADATELMATAHGELVRQKVEAEKSRDYWKGEATRLQRKVPGLKGRITFLKRILKDTENDLTQALQ